MKNSCVHWNGNQLCVIDCETTGLDITTDEILQLAILPLDSNIEPRTDVLPFCIYIQPTYPERISEEALKVNKLTLERVMSEGFDKYTAEDLLSDWIQKLGLPHTPSGRPKRIIPLGQNYLGFDKYFLVRWLGNLQYDEWFDYHCVDTMTTASYLNDRAAFRADRVPFPKISLTSLCSKLNIPYDQAHDALADCLMCAQVYKRMLQMGGALV